MYFHFHPGRIGLQPLAAAFQENRDSRDGASGTAGRADPVPEGDVVMVESAAVETITEPEAIAVRVMELEEECAATIISRPSKARPMPTPRPSNSSSGWSAPKKSLRPFQEAADNIQRFWVSLSGAAVVSTTDSEARRRPNRAGGREAPISGFWMKPGATGAGRMCCLASQPAQRSKSMAPNPKGAAILSSWRSERIRLARKMQVFRSRSENTDYGRLSRSKPRS